MKVLLPIKTFLGKIRFFMGFNPKRALPKKKDAFVPNQYESVLILSADFELAWAWLHAKGIIDNYNFAIEKANTARKNIPKILDLCDQYSIPITWATVGHLFLDKCDHSRNIKHPEIEKLAYFENEYWTYKKGGWFDYDPCSNFLDSPAWYAPDLLKEILARKVNHEIGCHTFSHIDCRDSVCSSDVFNSEVYECIRLASEYGVRLSSFVHPAHTIGNLDNLKKLGFTNYRTNKRNILGYPILNENGLWELEQTAELINKKSWSVNYQIHRYKKIIDRAIRSNTVCYLWFHPSMDSIFVDEIMPELFSYIMKNKEKIWITTSEKYIEWLNEKTKK